MDFDAVQAVFARTPPESLPEDAELIGAFAGSSEPLSKDRVIELRKDILNQAYRMIAAKDIRGSYLLTLLTALKKLAKNKAFGEGINLKMYWDIVASLIMWCCTEKSEDQTACLINLMSSLLLTQAS